MKKVISLALVVLMLFSFAACSASEADVVGTWEGSWDYEGKNITVELTVSSDGTYSRYTNTSGSETGTWELSGTKLSLYDDSATVYHGICMEYKYIGGKLTNSGHSLTKVG